MLSVQRVNPARHRFDPKTHTYWSGDTEIPSVTSVLTGAGLIDTTWYTDCGRIAGSAMHLACQLDDERDLDENHLDCRLVPYLTAWRRFKKDTGFESEMIEKPLFDTALKFGGTPDRIGRLNDVKRAIVDIKKGQRHPAYAIQLAAYASLTGQPFAYTRLGVRLLEDGQYQITEYPRSKFVGDLSIFLSALNICNWKQKERL